MLRIYPVELNCVGGVYTPVDCRDPVYITILPPICDWCRKLETGSRLTTGAFTPPTRRNSTSLSANCSDSSRLVETVANQLQIQYTPPTQLNSTVELRRRRRCVLGFSDKHRLNFRIHARNIYESIECKQFNMNRTVLLTCKVYYIRQKKLKYSKLL